VGDNNQGGKEDSGELDIEADILAELDSLRPNNGPSSSTLHPTSQKISLVTLDIPCVSFVRFPTTTKSRHDPVDIVRKLCQSAARKDSSGPRSRYIKRLTPVTLIRKVLSNGLESLCDEVLPAHFQIDEGPDQEPPSETEDDRQGRDSKLPKHGGCKFAIRPTIRNNNKIDRDHVIQVVAAKITELGHGAHSVDLKGYDKLVLVDVYRNVVGMSVVGGEFETLKRFNLAEIHASHFEEDAQDGKEKEKSRS
jgi:tRNA acetyltransferase TAN1